MSDITVKTLLESGVHFGHKTSRWNPKMAPFIFGKRNKVHIFNLRETIRAIFRAKAFVKAEASKGKKILFVGTKRQARNVIREQARACGMPFVSERWLGGALTNLRTIRERVGRLEELESLEATGEISRYSKKMVSTLTRERRKIFRNLEGIRDMTDLPAVLVVIDPMEERIAVAEAKRLNIPVVALVDSDGSPENLDIVIPGNDDALRGIELILSTLAESILEGRNTATVAATSAEGEKASAKKGGGSTVNKLVPLTSKPGRGEVISTDEKEEEATEEKAEEAATEEKADA